MITLSVASLEDKIASVFYEAGVDLTIAKQVAHHLVLAEIDGQSGHGLSRIVSYLAQVKSGKLNPQAVIKLTHPSPAVLEVDADYGFAYPAIKQATEALPKLARDYGIAMAVIGRSHHAGVLAHFVEALAEQGVIALMVANTPAAIAPWGGNIPIFGTNPIAFAMPRPNAQPLVMDFSVSKVARGKIMRAAKNQEPIPQGWGLDQDGKSTTDPEQVLLGSLCPAGDVKGALLALMIECLTAGLSGSNFGFEASSFFDGEGQAPNLSQTLIAITPPARIERIETLFSAILAQDGCRLPRESIEAKRKHAQAHGITINEADYKSILNI